MTESIANGCTIIYIPILLMGDIWKLCQDLNIYNCCHIYRESNRTSDCLAKKGICNTKFKYLVARIS